MSEKFTDDLLDIKNDRRFSVYCYRAGFGCWLLYIVSGARFMRHISEYRTDFGVFAFFLMVVGMSASLYYDYYHHPSEFEQKKKWLIMSYLVLAALIYFFVLGKQVPTFDELPSFGDFFGR
jgi:FtsH-binding integral membrane protein